MIAILILLIVLGAVVAFAERGIPMDPAFKYAIRLVALLIVIWAVLAVLGIPWPRPGSI